MSAYDIDNKEAEALIDQKTKLINEQMKLQVAHRDAINKILNEE